MSFDAGWILWAVALGMAIWLGASALRSDTPLPRGRLRASLIIIVVFAAVGAFLRWGS